MAGERMERPPPPSIAIAAALEILRSKPLFISASDFIDRLRQCMPLPPATKEYEPCSNPDVNPKLDWKKRCLASEAREEDLLNQISAQTRELEGLKATAAALAQRKPASRKRGQKDEPPANKKLSTDALPDIGLDCEWHKLAQEMEQSSKDCRHSKTFLRHLFDLKNLQTEAHPNSHKLARSLMAVFNAANQLAAATTSHISQPACQNLARDENDGRSHTSNTKILFRTLRLLSPAFEKLSFQVRNQPSARDAPIGAVIHAALSLFKTLLNRLAVSSAQLEPTGATHPIDQSIENQASESIAVACRETASLLATFLQHLLHPPLPNLPQIPRASSSTALDRHTNQSYERMAEGCQYLLLTRAGELLHRLVLRQPAPTSPSPQLDVNNQAQPLTKEETAAAALEAKFLTPLVKRACALSSSPHTASNPDAENGALAELGRQRFLATLVSACFKGDADLILAEDWAEPLEGPYIGDESGLERLLGEVDRDVEDGSWGFLGEMWEMFGWDVMLK